MLTTTDSGQQPAKSAVMDNLDDLELEAQGYTREMPRQFSTLSLMSMCYALLATWNGYGSAFGTGFTEASFAGSVWTLCISGFLTLITAAGMAELSSAYPVAGAQYYWSYVISRPDWAPFAAYLSASISTFGWWLALASVTNFIAAMIVGCVSLCREEYVIEKWHIYLVFVVITWMAVALNIFGSRLLPIWNNFLMYFSLVLLAVTLITLLACAAPNFQSGKTVFTDMTNSTGQSNNGLAFLLCLLNSLYGYLGVDCGAHLCEEIPQPTVNVPKVILYPVIVGFITTFPFAISLGFVITDFEAVINTRTGLPLVEAYYQATNSKAATVVLICGFALCLFGAACANITTSSRQLWSASRDNCFPLSRWWREVHPKYEMPMKAACASGTFVTLYGLIFLGSSTVFSSMVSACIVFMNTSYVVPQGILAWRGRERVLPARHMNLGMLGLPLNIMACLWVIFADVMFCLPTAYPVTLVNMNWTSVVVAGLFTYIIIAWFVWQRKVFKGPTVNQELANEVRQVVEKSDGVIVGLNVVDDAVTPAADGAVSLAAKARKEE